MSDRELTSGPATVTITVNAVNDPPTVASVSESTVEDTPKVVALQGSDLDGNPLTFIMMAGPAHGSLGPVVGNTVVYTPNPAFSGADSFSYKANDGIVDSNVAVVTITVTDTPGEMAGAGRIDAGGRRHYVQFRVFDRRNGPDGAGLSTE